MAGSCGAVIFCLVWLLSSATSVQPPTTHSYGTAPAELLLAC